MQGLKDFIPAGPGVFKKRNCIDTSEINPGIKDIELINKLMSSIRNEES